MANALESDFIGLVDHEAADFKGLTERLQTLAKNLPPSHVIGLTDLGSMLGAVIAFIEHGDAVIHAATHGAIYTAAQLGRKEVAQVQASIAGDLRNELAGLLARAEAAGINLGAAQAAPAPTAAPTAPASQPALTPDQLAAIAAVINAGK